jgi:hypothetical protein
LDFIWNLKDWGQIFSIFNSDEQLEPDWWRSLIQTRTKIEKIRSAKLLREGKAGYLEKGELEIKRCRNCKGCIGSYGQRAN